MTGVDMTRAGPPERTLTDEQEAILAERPDHTIIVEAAAGSGKTSTLVEYANKWRNQRGLYLAFNKEIANEARQRFPSHVTAKTAHAYAFHSLGVAKHKNRLVGRIRRNTIRQSGIDVRTDYLSPDRMMRAILDGITNFCIDGGKDLLPHHCGLDRSPAITQQKVLPQIAQVVRRFLDYENSGLPFTHDIYLKRLEMHGGIGDIADYLMVDEAQDLNPVLLSLVRKSGKPAIIVGDPRQSIYAFRGAIDALSSIEGPRFPLSQSWRFGTDVADLANHVLSHSSTPIEHPIRGRPDRVTQIEAYAGQAPARSMVLARTNSRLFEGLVKINAKFHVAGGFDTLASQLLSAWALSQNDQWNVTDGYVRSFNTWEDFVEEASEEDPDAKRLVKIVKEHGAQIPATIERLRSMHQPHWQDAQIILSTAHKAKGLEADTVVVCDDFETPAEMEAKLLEEKIGSIEYEQELNLLYVAVTRARYRLLLPPPLYAEAMAGMRKARAKAA